ncbi:MAG: hypothetical protein HYY62_01490 [Deltaproteobacteria bacterium]|nr:hypothetical protein [Deltaproteobacteria bacterium]
MNQPDVVSALEPLIKVLNRLNIPYYVGGSIASSTYGAFRATRDVDMVFNLDPKHVDELVNSLKSQYYIDRDMILEAIQHRSSFNLIHLKTMFKIDVFILKERTFDHESFKRKKENKIDASTNLTVYVSSPEDVILHKLEWYRAADHISDRQWSDVLSVLKVQGDRLDMSYMENWAKKLGILDLLEKALSEIPKN